MINPYRPYGNDYNRIKLQMLGTTGTCFLCMFFARRPFVRTSLGFNRFTPSIQCNYNRYLHVHTNYISLYAIMAVYLNQRIFIFKFANMLILYYALNSVQINVQNCSFRPPGLTSYNLLFLLLLIYLTTCIIYNIQMLFTICYYGST